MGKNAYNINDLKIMIVSTPKTGNTWVKHLLSNIYELPIVNVGPTFKAAEVDALGSRWVAHQHYTPQTDLIDWAQRNNIAFVTTVRHPGDVLLSMFHFIRNNVDHPLFANDPMRVVVRENDTIGDHIIPYLVDYFFTLLDISLYWMHSGESRAIRYEDLWRDPVTALQNLTAFIREVPLDRIKCAIELCDIALMRTLPGGDPRFFRAGNVGDWKQALPPQIINIFRHTEPYPAQFAALGYTLEPDDPLTTLPRKWSSGNPFRDLTHFNNGIPIPPLAIQLYLSLDPVWCKRWPSLEQTTADSFYTWLNAPADTDPQRQEQSPIVTNLANYIYNTRPDLRAAFPDLFEQDRHRFAQWFITHAPTAYALDGVFFEPVRSSVRIISQSIPETNNVVPSSAFSLRRKLSSLVRKACAKMGSNRAIL